MKYVKPGGCLAIVLPRSIANNPGLKFIRKWLLLNARIVASIDLPKETFAEGGGVPNPSVLIMRKLTPEERTLAQAGVLEGSDVLMAIPEKVGIDKRGNPTYARTAEGMVVLDADNNPSVDDDLPGVVSDFERWRAGAAPAAKSYLLSSAMLAESDEMRLDAGHYSPALLDARRVLERSGLKLERLGDVVARVILPNRISKRIYVAPEAGLPFLQGSHVVHFQPADLKYLSPASHRNVDAIVIRAGWLLVTRSGTVGRVAICPPEWDGWAASEHIIRIVPDETKCPSGYLCSFLTSALGQAQLRANVHGAVVDELTDEQVRNVLVPVPEREADLDVVRAIDRDMKRAVALKSQAIAAAQASVAATTAWLRRKPAAPA